MSIKKRLILSNIAMIIVPIVLIFVVEIMLGYFLFYIFDGGMGEKDLKLFLTIRFIAFLFILVLTNGLLTYFVSKSIIKPVNKLSEAAKQISEGNLEYGIHTTSKDELGKLSETFDTMRLKLKEASEIQARYDENRRELIANISHDLKTPMTSIKGYVKGVRDGVANTPEKMDRYIETIYTKANDMDQLIDELFLYSKLDLQQAEFQFGKIDLYTYFSDFIEELRFDLEQENDIISFLANREDAYIVMADREKLKRVVTNIIQNSIKYMNKDKKVIQVHLKSEASQVVVGIRDNGSGIAREAIPFVFDRFYRTDASRNTTTGGSGLGLAIVKRIIDEHGGDIWAESKLGEGTCIYFTLNKPLSEEVL